MKTIGLIGGMSWESSLQYYRIINQRVKEELGGLHSAKSLMVSVDFDRIEKLQHQGRWDELAQIMADCARQLERGGADLVVICTNTMHKVAGFVQSAIGIPLLHIADAAADEIKSRGLKRVGLLGTRFTMEEDFYTGRLTDRHGIEVLIPGEGDRKLIHGVIFEELCLGKTEETSKDEFLRIIDRLMEQGAEGIVLGCTEIPLLIGQKDVPIPVLDTTSLHAEAAVRGALTK